MWRSGKVQTMVFYIDAIKLNRGRYAGAVHSTLNLGFDGYRQVALLDNPDAGDHNYRLIRELQEQHVLRMANPQGDQLNAHTVPGTQQPAHTLRALNFVSGWDTSAASYLILTPTLISILISIIWPAVAVRVFEADVQTSIQTGTAVASYIITAGNNLPSLAPITQNVES
jgi:hypothetical protein